MAEQQQSENGVSQNQRSLERLARAIALSQGQFSLVFVRCNYVQLREQMLHQLQTETLPAISPQLGKISIFTVPPKATTLYNSIHGKLCQHQENQAPNRPAALMVLGLENVEAIEELASSTNVVRDEFRKRLSFPLVLWVSDRILQKLVRLAPDFASFAANPIKFDLSTPELQQLILQRANSLFSRVLEPHPDKPPFAANQYRPELDFARRELQERGVVLEPELDACLQYVLGQDDFANNQIDSAICRYRSSLRYWRNTNQLERQGVLLFHLGLSFCRNAENNPKEDRYEWEEAWIYLNQCVQVFEEAKRQDLVAQIISQLCEVLQRLEAWEALEATTNKALALHQIYGTKLQLALDYGFLAKMALTQLRWQEASQRAATSLALFTEIRTATIPITPLQPQPLGLYRLLWEQIFRLILVKAQRRTGELQAAAMQLERACEELASAIEASDPRYDPQRYLRLLKGLRSLYFEEGRYREAFILKKQQRSIEQQYGFRAFIGAGQLLPARLPLNPALTTPSQDNVSQAIAASNRQQDVYRLIERISRRDYKLTVIHGQSGVGKSSIVSAGLVPTLQSTAIGAQIALPVVVRVYSDWVSVLARQLTMALKVVKDIDLTQPLISASDILEQLRQNEERNLLTVLIFDQFEEFFFACSTRKSRQEFYQFFQACINISSVKIILSIREDYLHHLLELEQLPSLNELDCNVLDKRNRYPLGNFTKTDAYQVIASLTEKAHFHLEPALITALVEDLAAEKGEVRPIELQIVGAQLQAENITTLSKYQQSGPKQRLVERFLESVIEDCGIENETQARRVLYLLTDETGIRLLKTRAELVADLAGEADQIDLILEILVDSGLVYIIPEIPAPRYQLVHDYLVEFIHNKEQVNLAEERDEYRKKNEQIQQEIDRISQQNELLAELAEVRYKIVQKDLETFIPNREQSNTVADLSAARKRDELNHIAIEQLRQEEELLAALASAKQKRAESEKQRKRFLNTALVSSAIAICALAASTILAISQSRQAQVSEIKALSATSEALFASNKQIDALKEGIRAAKRLQRTNWADANAQSKVLMALQQAVYEVKERNRLEGHLDAILSVSYSPDGQYIASASWDKTVRLWQQDGHLIKVITGHSDRVSSVSWSPDGQLIASASWDGTVKLWRKDGSFSGIELTGHSDKVLSVTFSPNGQLLATASADQTIKLWRKDGTLVKTLSGHAAPVTSISFSPDSQKLVSGSADSTVKLWRIDGTFVKTLTDHDNQVTSVSWSLDGELVASASLDKTVKLWSADGNLVTTLTDHDDSVFSVSFSPDSQTLASASWDNTVKLWSRDGMLLNTLKGHSDWVFGISFSPDGKFLASASRDRSVKIWSLDNSLLTTLKGSGSAVNAVVFSPDGQLIASAEKDKTIKLWKRDRTLVATLTGHQDAVNNVSFSPNGQFIASASADRTVKIWRKDGSLVKTLSGHGDRVLGVSWSPDSQLVASSSLDKTVKLWKPDGTLVATLTGHDKPVNWVSFSPNGQFIASASEDKTIKLWRSNGSLVRTFLGHTEGVWAVSFSPDSQLIASASADYTVKLWNLNGRLLRNLDSHRDWVSSVSFSADGRTLASGSADGTIKLWTREGRLLHTLKGHSSGVTSASFGPNGAMLASADTNGTVILWNLADLNLENLLARGCTWLQDYLQTNPNAQGDRALCNGIDTLRLQDE